MEFGDEIVSSSDIDSDSTFVTLMALIRRLGVERQLFESLTLPLGQA
jgi:hypothetical protein